MGGPAVDRDGLAGEEIAVGGSQEHQSPEQVFRVFVAFERAPGQRWGLRMGEMAWVLVDHAVAERKSRRQIVDADIVLAELARHRAGERGDRALRGHVMGEIGYAA